MVGDVRGVPTTLVGIALEPSGGDNVETIVSHSTNVGSPVILNPASKATISDSLELCVTAPCFFTNHASGTNVLGPTRAK